MKSLLTILTSFILTLTFCFHANAQDTAWDRVEKIEKGYNLSGWLEAAKWITPFPDPTAYTEDELRLLAQLGFKTVRVPVQYEWIVTEYPPYDTIVDQSVFDIINNTIIPIADQSGMTVILDNHHGIELTDANFTAELPRVCGQWKFLTQYYANLPHDRYFFDLKGGGIGPLSSENLRTVQQAIIDTIRVYDTDRTLLARWFDASTAACNDVQNNIIYGLFDFQNASFVQGGETILRNKLIAARDWSDTQDVPVIIHEFGIDYLNVDESVRCDYIEAITHLSDSLNIPWISWDIKSTFPGGDAMFNDGIIHEDSLIECFSNAMELDPVLPGDFNNDKIVTVPDLMYFMQAEGNTGPIRPDATTDYTPQWAPDWDEEVYGVNGKHQDANGDGIVDANDLDVFFMQDYCIECDEDMQLEETCNFRLKKRDTTVNGNPAHIYDIYIDDLPIANSVAFRLEYNIPMKYDITIDEQNSWLMPDEDDIIWFHDTGLQRIDIFINSADGAEQINNEQPVASIVTVEDLLQFNTLKSVVNPSPKVSKGVAATNDTITGITEWSLIDKLPLPSPSFDIDVSPNPILNTSSNLNIQLEEDRTGYVDIMIMDVHGRVIASQEVYVNSGSVTIPIEGLIMNKLKSGIYLVHLKSEEWQSKPQKLMYLH